MSRKRRYVVMVPIEIKMDADCEESLREIVRDLKEQGSQYWSSSGYEWDFRTDKILLRDVKEKAHG